MTEEQIQEREDVLCGYIDKFITEENNRGYQIDVDSKVAAENIVALYERYAEDVVRPAINSSNGTIHHFKIISNTELAILRVNPIDYPSSQEDERKLNAKLALKVGLGFLLEWNKNDFDNDEISKLFEENKEIKDFLDEHLKWLFLVDTRHQYPIFLNAQVWRLFYLLIKYNLKK